MPPRASLSQPSAPRPTVRFSMTDSLAPWLHRHRVSLVVSTYQAGKLLLLSSPDGARVSILDRTIPSCMGLAVVGGDTLWVAARGRLLRFSDGGPHGRHDRRFLPRVTYYTSDIDAHDVAVDDEGPLVVATAYNALVRVDERHSFKPWWRPSFIGESGPGDRCHLNGLAVHQGRAVAATLASPSVAIEGWRAGRHSGGQVVSVPDGEVLADGLCMPHSPRVHRGEVWVLDSGRGGLVRVKDGACTTVTQLPGFTRGLAFVGDHAIVGLSGPRTMGRTDDLPFARRLAREGRSAQCGLDILDLDAQRIVASFRIEGSLIQELYDVVVLPDSVNPTLVGFRGEDRFTAVDLGPEP